MNFYAEEGTDRFIREKFFPKRTFGSMIEVGAAGPTFLSMSRHFRESGWRVLAIEPNPHFINQHKASGFDVLPYACGSEDKNDVDFEIVHQPASYGGGTISYESFSALAVKDSYRKLNPSILATTIKVNLRRLDTIIHDHAPDMLTIDLISIDVEGWELQVLDGFDLERYKPVVLIENFLEDPAYKKYMKSRGYKLHSKRAPNEIYVPSWFYRLAQRKPNVATR